MRKNGSGDIGQVGLRRAHLKLPPPA